MLAYAGEFHDFHYMENEPTYSLPYEVAFVSNDVRDFCNECGEVKRVGNYFVGNSELGEGMFAKVKKGIHALTGEQVGLRERGVAAISAFPLILLMFTSCDLLFAGGHQDH